MNSGQCLYRCVRHRVFVNFSFQARFTYVVLVRTTHATNVYLESVYHCYCNVNNYSVTCLVSTWVSTFSWLVSTLHSVPSSCTLCQPVLIVSTSDKKYRFGVPFKVLAKQVGLYLRTPTMEFMYFPSLLQHF